MQQCRRNLASNQSKKKLSLITNVKFRKAKVNIEEAFTYLNASVGVTVENTNLRVGSNESIFLRP